MPCADWSAHPCVPHVCVSAPTGRPRAPLTHLALQLLQDLDVEVGIVLWPHRQAGHGHSTAAGSGRALMRPYAIARLPMPSAVQPCRDYNTEVDPPETAETAQPQGAHALPAPGPAVCTALTSPWPGAAAPHAARGCCPVAGSAPGCPAPAQKGTRRLGASVFTVFFPEF